MENINSNENQITSTKTIFQSEEDFKYVFKMNRPIAKILCIWPFSFNSPISQIIKLFYVVLMIYNILNHTLTGIFEDTIFLEKMVLLTNTNFTIAQLFKYIMLWIHKKKIEACMIHVKEDWDNCEKIEHRELMRKNVEFGHYLATVFGTFMYSGAFVYCVVKPIMKGTIVTEMNITIKSFPYIAYGEYTTESPAYEIIFILQILTAFVLFSSSFIAFTYTSILSIHACAQLELVILKLSQLFIGEGKGVSEVNEELNLIFKQHLRILRFVSNLESCTNEFCFVHMMCSTLEICVLGLGCIMSWKVNEYNVCISYFTFLLSAIFSVYIYCYVGELLISKSISAGESAYATEWYDFSKSVRLNLIHLIRYSNYPFKITAGKLIILSMTTFCYIIRSAGAYFNFIWNISQ